MNERRQDGCFRIDQLPDIPFRVLDSSPKGRVQTGIFKIQLSRFEIGLVLLDIGVGFSFLGHRLFLLLLRTGSLRRQVGITLDLTRPEGELGIATRQISFHDVECCLKGPGINFIEPLIFFDDASLDEFTFGDVSRYPRDNIDVLDGLHRSTEGINDGNCFLNDCNNHN